MLEFLDNSLKLEEDVFRAHKNFEQEKKIIFLIFGEI